MPQFNATLTQIFSDVSQSVRVAREIEPGYPESPPTFDVFFWKDTRIQQCPDGTERYAAKAETLMCLTRAEAETLVRTLQEALDYTDDSEAACDCRDCGGGTVPVVP